MFASTSQTATYFFVPDVTRASDRSVDRPVSAPVSPSMTAPVRVAWVIR